MFNSKIKRQYEIFSIYIIGLFPGGNLFYFYYLIIRIIQSINDDSI
ncbi:hypothetical protein PROVRETT_07390 [Providencia rettgeri DSM 1131]|nr:hypothetical protein PROVRETT_07390 [Providencia rettgeri DSM 1131]